MFLLVPVKDQPEMNAEELLRILLGKGWFVFRDNTHHRKSLKPGDQICFYRKGVGVVAKATVASAPEKTTLPFPFPLNNPENFPWVFQIHSVEYFFDEPVEIDEALRGKLERFRGKDPTDKWAWFVQCTRSISEQDFKLLSARH